MPIKFLRELNAEEILDVAISVLYMYTRTGKGVYKNTTYLSEVICAIGHNIRNANKLKRDSALAAKSGAFLLYSFQSTGIMNIKLAKAKNSHAVYIIDVLNDELLCELWETISSTKLEKLPSLTPYEDWTTARHPTGLSLVKTSNRDVLDTLAAETHPLVFETVNKAQQTGWNVNAEVYELFNWAFRNKQPAFDSIWTLQSFEAKISKTREVKTIGSIAKRYLGLTFYHAYYLDFRGRKYPVTSYFHEQGSDVSRGLLLRADKKAIGEAGYFWLLVSIASNWAGDAGRSDGAKTDKIPLKERVAWVKDNLEIILSYAENPKVNKGWMSAENPWQFIAACIELRKVKIFEEEAEKLGMDSCCGFDYESQLEVYIDGSNNGSQHLAALTKDEVTAPHVNLIASDLPGDLYRYVADHVWETINAEVVKIPNTDLRRYEQVIATIVDYQSQIRAAEPKSDRRKELIEKIIAYKKKHSKDISEAAPVYWSKITDNKHRRKIVKRNIMTLPYGGTSYGLGQQQIDDARKHGIEHLNSMEHKWGAYLGRVIYDDCRVSLAKPMMLLYIFEEAGRRAEAAGEFLRWTVPVTGFPVVQNYIEGISKRVYVQYGPPEGERTSTGYYANTLQLEICFIENTVNSKRRQSQAASPNAIHSLDSAHLMMTVCACDFPVTTIHDSFGCLLADMPQLYVNVREQFAELYRHDPLMSIMNDIGGDLSNLVLGSLNTDDVIDSEFCFV